MLAPAMVAANARTRAIRGEAAAALVAVDPRARTKDSDYVFDQLEHQEIVNEH